MRDSGGLLYIADILVNKKRCWCDAMIVLIALMFRLFYSVMAQGIRTFGAYNSKKR